MNRRRALRPDEIELWRHVVAGIDPLPGRAPPEAPAVEAAPPSAPAAQAPEPLTPAARPPAKPVPPPLAPMERRQRRRTMRGQHPIDGAIDLHGMRQAEAHAALLRFVERSQREGAALVLVVTGKGSPKGEPAGGYAEPERGVLRRLVPHWLADPLLRRFVLGFETAGQGHGGDGALYVRIRRARG